MPATKQITTEKSTNDENKLTKFLHIKQNDKYILFFL